MASDGRRIVILAEGTFDFHHGKTATSLLRYRAPEVVAVIDSDHAGQTAQAVVGVGGSIPICRDIDEGLQYRPTELVIGIAPRGGGLPAEWRRQILTAIDAGLDVVSGLHFMLNDDREFVEAAEKAGVRLVDVRTPPADLSVASMRPRREGSHVITFVGSDCAVGKMTAALEMHAAAGRRGLSTAFVATGQTGIMLEGAGIAVDRVIGDFMAGAIEDLVVEACERADWVFVEGQGSLLHPGYSGVTLALLHGSQPDAMVLVYPPTRTTIEDYPISIPPVERLVDIYEEAAGWIKPARVVAVALNTRDMDDVDARAVVAQIRQRTGLVAADPVKGGSDELVNAVVEAFTPVDARGAFTSFGSHNGVPQHRHGPPCRKEVRYERRRSSDIARPLRRLSE